MLSQDFTRLLNSLGRWPRAVLLFSGGLDSSLLLAVGARVLGPGLIAATFTGPHTAPGELARAVALARRLQVRHLVREFSPLTLPEFRTNSPARCYVCKRAVIELARGLGRRLAADVILDGSQVDDLKDIRPGLRAVRELGVHSPLLEAGLGKTAIRHLSRALDLDWDRPPQSCLATRFPVGAKLTSQDLNRVARAEAWLMARGFALVRLRVGERRVRLELPVTEWAAFLQPQVRRPFAALLHGFGWPEAELAVPRHAGAGPSPP